MSLRAPQHPETRLILGRSPAALTAVGQVQLWLTSPRYNIRYKGGARAVGGAGVSLVTKVGDVTQYVHSVPFRCDRCGHETEIVQWDQFQLSEPLECVQADGCCGRQRGRSCKFLIQGERAILRDQQYLELRGLGDSLRPTEVPGHLILRVRGQLLDRVTAGDHLDAIGLVDYELLQKAGRKTPHTRLVLDLMHADTANRPWSELEIHPLVQAWIDGETMHGPLSQGALLVEAYEQADFLGRIRIPRDVLESSQLKRAEVVE